MKYKQPYIIEFEKIGDEHIGFLSTMRANNELPFEVRRFFTTYNTPEIIVRGRHAHFKTEQILFALHSQIIVNTETAQGGLSSFLLNAPNQGLYIPPNVWHSMVYHKNAVQFVMASTEYDELDYIRDYGQFLAHWK